CILFYHTPTTPSQIYTLSLHDALPIFDGVITTGAFDTQVTVTTVGSIAFGIADTGNNSVSVGGLASLVDTTNITLQATNTVTVRSEEHTSELQSQSNLVCRLLLEKKNK